MQNAPVGLFGKLPAQADYFRANNGEWARLGLDRWFQEAHEVVHGERTRLPEEPVFFQICPPGRTAFVGVFSPSQDAVGRTFPLVLFATVDAEPLVSGFPAVPTAYARFLDEAAGVLEHAPQQAGAELAARAQTLNGLPYRLPDADAEAVLAGESLAPLGLALGGLPHGAAYAMRTLRLACEQARANESAAKPAVITIEAPAPTDAARLLWLELVRQRLGRRQQAPTMYWTKRASGRLLVTLGPPASGAFALLANPRHRGNRFWPLKTEVDAALDQAVADLAPDERRVLETPGATLADLLRTFGR